MSVHLAKIIAVLDRNSGLEHCRPDRQQQQQDWSRKLFVDLINVVEFDWPVEDTAAFQ